MNILAVDFAKNRTGLAWVQTGLDVILPFGVLSDEQGSSIKDQLIDVIREEHIEQVVFGLPVGEDGEENYNTKRIRTFVEELKKDIDIVVHFVNERFTTQEAKTMEGDAHVDEKAAMLILETFLHSV